MDEDSPPTKVKESQKHKKGGKRRELNHCPECKVDNKTMQGSIHHFLLLVADNTYMVKSLEDYENSSSMYTGYNCPVCNLRVR